MKMTTQEQYIERLKEMVIAQFGREITTTEDCISLSNALSESVGAGVDVESLEQFFLAETYLAPRPVTLSLLARYVGFTGWSDFCTAGAVAYSADSDRLSKMRRWLIIALAAIAVLAIVITAVVIISRNTDEVDTSLMVDSRFRNLESKWISSTSERCNTLREYYDEANAEQYNERVDRFIERYRDYLHRTVKPDVENFVLKYKITVDNNTIDQTTEIIIERCLKMVDDIKID